MGIRTILVGAVSMAAGLLLATPSLAQQPVAGFHYEASERVGAEVRTAYRFDFQLLKTPDGGLTAVVIQAAKSDHGGPFVPAAVSAECRLAMHAPPGALAAVRLWPAPVGPDPLGPAFLDACAPAEVFYPLTDIMNVAIIPLAPKFGARGLRTPGETRPWPGLTAQFERFGRRFEEHVPGGTLTLVASSPGETTVDWRPEPADLTIEDHGPPPVRLHGVERWAFRVSFDPGDGMLRSAQATEDSIDVVVSMPGLPAERSPHVNLTRTVSISRADGAPSK